MGFNTTVVIYNDALAEVKKDKNFGQRLYDAIMENLKTNETVKIYTDGGAAGEVIEQHHSNHIVTVKVGYNTGEIDYE